MKAAILLAPFTTFAFPHYHSSLRSYFNIIFFVQVLLKSLDFRALVLHFTCDMTPSAFVYFDVSYFALRFVLHTSYMH